MIADTLITLGKTALLAAFVGFYFRFGWEACGGLFHRLFRYGRGR